jgi:hypothetical protein
MPADLLGACQLIMINHPVTISYFYPWSSRIYLGWFERIGHHEPMMDYNDEAYSTKEPLRLL